MSKKISSVHVEMSADSAKLEAGLKKAKGGLEDLKGKAQTVAKPVNDIKSILSNYAAPIGAATAAFGALATASKMAFDAGKMGADLLYVQGKFDNLTASIGATSDALLKDLRAATKGMVSDAQLVQSAGDFMALGLAKSRDEVVRLTTVAGALGMDMNQLVLTLTNQTTMRFDALGVSVDGFDAKVKKLKDSGMDANAAFKEAFLQQAEEQLARVGNKADSGAGAIMRMEASVENLKNNLRMGLAPAVVSVSNAINDMITNGQPAKDAIAAQAKGVNLLTENYDNYLSKLKEVAREQGYTIREVNGSLYMFNSSGIDVTYMLKGFSKSAYEADQHLSRLAAQYRNTTAAVDTTSGSLSNHALILSMAAQKIADAREAAAHAAQRWDNWNSRILGSISALNTLDNMNPDFGNTIQAEIDKIEWFKLGGEDVQLAFEQIKQAAREGILTPEEADAALKELYVANAGIQAEMDDLNIDKLAKRIQEVTGGSMEDARLKAVSIQTALEEGTLKEYIYDIKYRFTLINPPKIGPGWTPVEQGPKPKNDATGGPVFSGQSYIVGEHGPEVFTPSSSGGITANNRVGGGSPIINIYPLPGQNENAIAARVVAMLRRGNTRSMAGATYAGV